MIENILSKLGAIQVVKTKISGPDSAKINTYNNGLTTAFVADVKIGEDMEVSSFYNKFEVFINNEVVFSYEYTGDGSEEAYENCFNNLYLALEKMVNELLTPIKPSKNKIERLAKMTIENGCTMAEALTARILMNKLILRTCVN